MAKKSYDWAKIKVDFLSSSLSVREFAEANDISFGTLKRKVSQELWLEERSNIAPKVIQKTVEKTVEKKSDELSEFEGKSLEAIKKAQKKIIAQIDLSEKAGELKALSGALVDLQKVYRLALGASTENQATGNVSEFGDWLREIESGKFERNGEITQ